ncbi:MAG TPA: hypothetical protein VFQ44_11300 [Streptosporangiaceae bacterium]|nr:hypothetical protein [Streptosporangiaceae bacterium]
MPGPGGRTLTTRLIEPGPAIRQLFHEFQYTAFRLETRDRYDAPYENESLAKFIAGEPDNLPWMQSWLDMLREAAAAGRRFARVRVVTLPLTDYSRFGVWCAQFTGGAGEDIRYLARDQADEAELPRQDYWLFDSSRLLSMHFDEQDRFLGGELVTDATEIVKANYWRDAAWHKAVRRDDFAD